MFFNQYTNVFYEFCKDFLGFGYVATGAYSGVVDIRGMLRVVDIAAGKLIVEEAEGIVTGEDGNKLTTGILSLNKTPIIACGNKELHKKVLESLSLIGL